MRNAYIIMEYDDSGRESIIGIYENESDAELEIEKLKEKHNHNKVEYSIDSWKIR